MDGCAPMVAAGAGGAKQTRRLVRPQRPGVECSHRGTGTARVGVATADRYVAWRDHNPSYPDGGYGCRGALRHGWDRARQVLAGCGTQRVPRYAVWLARTG